MDNDRIHRAFSADGTEIAGRVHGQGPPLVLFHGAPHDGDLAWEALVPHLADRFTCYLPSWRGRGLSADSEDRTPPRHREDATFQQVGAAVAEGRLADAARAFHPFVASDDELAALDADYYERSGTAFPPLLRTLQATQTYEGPRATDPESMSRISVPVLLLRGQQTRRATFYADTERYVAQHVADPHVRELPGVGHFAPTHAPEPVAEAFVSFFGTIRQPA